MNNQAYFEALYAQSDDPWRYETRWYEARKRAVCLALLPDAVYESGIELGCGNGVLTEALAARCQRLLALDAQARAVALAQKRLASYSGVRVQQGLIPQDLPESTFDLIVISEILYYLSHEDMARVIAWVEQALAQGGALLCCHWRHPIAGCAQTGGQLHDFLRQSWPFRLQSQLADADFFMDVWQRDTKSVAQKEGLA